jgi:SanA protein
MRSFQILKLVFFSLILIVCFIILNDKIISLSTRSRIFVEIKKLPAYAVILVPGAGDSVNNYFFKGRMNAVAQIYNSKKIKKIIVSGRNDLPGYDEPASMAMALIERGVSAELIVKDYGAERTIESIEKIASENKQDSIIIVSQKAHLERALFIAKAKGLKAVGFVADDNPWRYVRNVFRLRETFSRLKCTFECLQIWIGVAK